MRRNGYDSYHGRSRVRTFLKVLIVLLLVVLALAGGLEEPLSELLLSALACAGIALIMNAVALPLLLKFGAEKARMVSMALFLLVFAGFALLGLAAVVALVAVEEGAYTVAGLLPFFALRKNYDIAIALLVLAGCAAAQCHLSRKSGPP